MTALSLKDLQYAYPMGTIALKGINLEIEQGSCVAILGSNGAGKSTLMDILLGFKAKAGIELFGKSLCAYGRKELGRTVALVPQSEHYNFSFTLLDYTLFGRAPYLSEMGSPSHKDAQIAFKALETVGLSEFADRLVTSLSGGEHQLLLLARSIAQESKVLLLDEPTSALDPANKRRVMTILKALHAEGKTILFTTHDANLAYELATHVAMLKKGILLDFGKKEVVVTSQRLSELYDTPMQVYTMGDRTFIY